MDERRGPDSEATGPAAAPTALRQDRDGAAGLPPTADGLGTPAGVSPAPPSRRMARARRAATALVDRVHAHLPRLRIALLALAGAALAVALLGRVPASVGPFETTFAARPSLSGHTVVHLAPLGTIGLDTHDWPLAIDLRVDEIAVADAERIARDPRAIDRLGVDAADEVRGALVRLAVRCVMVALLGGVAGALVARLSWRAAAGGLGVASLLVAVLGAGTAVTFDADAVAEPRYTGLLTRAPSAIGDIEAVLDRFGEYRAQLSDLVDNMATLYLAGSELPTFRPDGEVVRVLHVSDIHLNPQAFDLAGRLIDQFGVDLVVDTGDLTDWGTDPESRLVGRIGELEVPYVFVRGNHDSRHTQDAVGDQLNAIVLDGDGVEVSGLRFWGIGDPRYTPDKDQHAGESEQERAEAFAPEVAERLADDEPPAADVVIVHDRRIAGDLGGEVPLVLAGHGHEPDESRIEPRGDDDADEGDGTDAGGEPGAESTGEPSTTSTSSGNDESERDDQVEETLLLVEGSTGGAGLRGLQGEEPEPLTASILYFDPETRRLVAYDRITVAWLQDAGATIERHIVGDDADAVGEDAG